MRPFALVLVASIVSLSTGHDDDVFGRRLPIDSLLFLDKALYEFIRSEEEKCEMNPKRSYDKREPYPGYIPTPGSCGEPCNSKGVPEEPSQWIPEKSDTSNSEETLNHPSDSAKSNELGLIISEILDQVADTTSQPSENVESDPSKGHVTSVEENAGDTSWEDLNGLNSHEYESLVNSINDS